MQESGKMNKIEKLFSKRSIIVFTTIAAIVYLTMVLMSDWEALIAITISPWVILVFILLTTGNYLFRAAKWHLYSRELSVNISFKKNLVVFLSGLSMTITPVRVGEVLKCYLLKDLTKKKMSETIPAVVVERLTDIIALCLLSLTGIFISRNSALLAGVFSLVILILLVAIRNNRVYDVLSKLPLMKRFVQEIGNMYKSSRSLANKRVVVLSIIITLPAWFLECLGMWIILNALGIQSSILTVVFIFSFSSVFGALSMLPGGLGAAEASLTVLLMQLLSLNVTTAVWVAIITRICTLWYGTAIGVIFLSLTERLKN